MKTKKKAVRSLGLRDFNWRMVSSVESHWVTDHAKRGCCIRVQFVFRRKIFLFHSLVWCVCVCVCKWIRERVSPCTCIGVFFYFPNESEEHHILCNRLTNTHETMISYSLWRWILLDKMMREENSMKTKKESNGFVVWAANLWI